MNLLLDANVLIWLGVGSRGLTVPATHALQTATDLYFSPISVAAIGLKVGKGRLAVEPDLRTFIGNLVSTYGLKPLPFDEDSAYELEKLPMHHRDPFDRMLICQAIAHRIALVSADETIRKYPVQVIW